MAGGVVVFVVPDVGFAEHVLRAKVLGMVQMGEVGDGTYYAMELVENF